MSFAHPLHQCLRYLWQPLHATTRSFFWLNVGLLLLPGSLWAVELTLETLPSARLRGEPGTFRLVGAALAAGDLDSDGRAELVFGAPESSNGAGFIGLQSGCRALSSAWEMPVCGACPVIPDSLGLQELSFSQTPELLDSSLQGRAGEKLGQAVALVDLDGDGDKELVISAPGNKNIYLWKGPLKTGGTLEAPDVTLSGAEVDGLQSASAPGQAERLWLAGYSPTNGLRQYWTLDGIPAASSVRLDDATSTPGTGYGSLSPLELEGFSGAALSDSTALIFWDGSLKQEVCRLEAPLGDARIHAILHGDDGTASLVVTGIDSMAVRKIAVGMLSAEAGADDCLWRVPRWALTDTELLDTLWAVPDQTGDGQEDLLGASTVEPGEVALFDSGMLAQGCSENCALVTLKTSLDTANLGSSLLMVDLDGNGYEELVVGATEARLGPVSGSVFIVYDLRQYLDQDGDTIIPYRGAAPIEGFTAFDCDDRDSSVGTPPPSDPLGEGLECVNAHALSFADEEWNGWAPGACLAAKTQEVVIECGGSIFPLLGLVRLFMSRRKCRQRRQGGHGSRQALICKCQD